MTVFSFKHGATLPVREIELSGIENLQGVTSATFVYRCHGMTERNEIVCDIPNPASTTVEVDFTNLSEALPVGLYDWQIELSYNGDLMYFPGIGFNRFTVKPNIEE